MIDEATKQKAREIRGAIQDGDRSRVEALLVDGANLLNLMTPFGTWLHVAASAGKLDIVKMLVAMGIDPNERGDIFNGNPLHIAALDGHYEIVEYLLARGAEMDTSEPERNPLFGAILGGHFDIVKLLIAKGIDYSVKYTGESMKDMDALAFAHERGQVEIESFLQE